VKAIYLGNYLYIAPISALLLFAQLKSIFIVSLMLVKYGVSPATQLEISHAREKNWA
jgi:hypothetical protein